MFGKLWEKKQLNPANSQSIFKKSLTLAQRVQKRAAFKEKYPEADFCVTVIEGLSDIPTKLKRPKPYLLMGLQKHMTILHLIGYLKKALNVNQSISIIVLVGSNVVSMSSTLGELGHRFTDSDGFLYVFLKQEDSF